MFDWNLDKVSEYDHHSFLKNEQKSKFSHFEWKSSCLES